MKQRLLLALLVLFASVGTTWGQDDTLAVPEGGGEGGTQEEVTPTPPGENQFKFTVEKGKTATVTFGNVNNNFTVTEPSAPNVAEPVTAVINYKTLTVNNSKGTDAVTVTVAGGSYEKLTFSTGITDITFEAANTYLQTLDINGGATDGILSTLNINEITGSLRSLTIGVNKLKLASIPEKKSTYSKYSISAQSPTDLQAVEHEAANTALDLNLTKLGLNTIFPGETFKINNWKYKAANATSYSSTSYVHTDSSAPNRFSFYSGSTNYVEGNEWMDGAYTCEVEIASISTKYPGVVVVVPINVGPASYTWPTITILPNNTGSVTALKGSTTVTGTVVKGNKISLTPVPVTGYTFSKFEATGMTISKVPDSNDLYEATITGKTKDAITLKAVFVADTKTVTIQTPSHGSIVLYESDGTTEIKNNANVAIGKKIIIKANPEPGYQLDFVQVNGSKLGDSNYDSTGKYYFYTVSATDVTLIIGASFKIIESSTLSFIGESAGIASISVNGTSATEETGIELDDSYSAKKSTITFGTQPSIVIKTNEGYELTSIVSSNEETIKFTLVSANTYLVSGFTMPNTSLIWKLNTIKKDTPKILVAAAEGSYNGTAIVYDGTEKSVPYTTDPKDLSGVVLEYQAVTATGTSYWSKTGFKNAGPYKVKFSRPADSKYAAAKVYGVSGSTETVQSSGEFTFNITPATPIITTAPTVSISKEDGKYVISGGDVRYMRGTQTVKIESNKYVWVVFDGETPKTVSDNTTTNSEGKTVYKSEVVTVKLFLKDNTSEDFSVSDPTTNADENFDTSNASVQVKATGQVDDISNVTLQVYSGLPAGTTLSFMNGTKELGSSNVSVPEGTRITFKATAKGYTQAKIIQVDNNGTQVGTKEIAVPTSTSDITTDWVEVTGTKMIFSIKYSSAPQTQKTLVLVSAEDEQEYDGKEKTFTVGNIKLKTTDNESEVTVSDWSKATFTYKDANGTTVKAPVNAGTYTVTISRPADEASQNVGYKAFTATGTLVITKAEPTIIKVPATAKIGKGQPLSSAILTDGLANVTGSFEWVNPDEIVTVESSEGYAVKFVSKDPNYKDKVLEEKVLVEVSNESILSIASDETYTITVKGSDGKEYKNGQTVPVGITLTFTVTPASTYKLKTLYVNGKAISGSTYTTTAGPIAVKAEMEQEFTVSVSTTLKGIDLVLPNSSTVKKGESYSFSVKGLAADLANLVVSDGTNIYTGTNGAYTISNITANKTITVTMKAGTAPTQVEAVIEANLSTQGKSMGTVTVTKISSLRADAVDSSTQKFYYGDKIRVTATPAAGCRFVGWEGRTETISVIDVVITETSYKFKAVFAGSPTGAEVIEGVDIYGSNGEIVVRCDGAARITIVSMNGQSKQQEISGDTRIPAGAGIYGIVFEQGNNVMRTKVAVK